MNINLLWLLSYVIGSSSESESTSDENTSIVYFKFLSLKHPVTNLLESEITRYVNFEFNTEDYCEIIEKAESAEKIEKNSSLSRLSTVLIHDNVQHSHDLATLIEVVDFSKIISKNAEILASYIKNTKESTYIKEVGKNILLFLNKMEELSKVAAELVWQRHDSESCKKKIEELENVYEKILDEMSEIMSEILTCYANLVKSNIDKKIEIFLGTSTVHMALLKMLVEMVLYSCCVKNRSEFRFLCFLNYFTNEFIGKNKKRQVMKRILTYKKIGFCYNSSISGLTKQTIVLLYNMFQAEHNMTQSGLKINKLPF